MRERLPIEMDNLELPKEEKIVSERQVSYGFANILYLLGLIITVGSVLVVVFLGNRWYDGKFFR